MAKQYKHNESNLPVPRLQARIKLNRAGQTIVTYSLIKQNMEGLQEIVFHKGLFTTGMNRDLSELQKLRPHVTMQVMFGDMWNLHLPGFVLAGDKFEEIKLENCTNSIPNGVWAMMEKDKSRQEEYLKLHSILLSLLAEREQIRAARA